MIIFNSINFNQLRLFITVTVIIIIIKSIITIIIILKVINFSLFVNHFISFLKLSIIHILQSFLYILQFQILQLSTLSSSLQMECQLLCAQLIIQMLLILQKAFLLSIIKLFFLKFSILIYKFLKVIKNFFLIINFNIIYKILQ